MNEVFQGPLRRASGFSLLEVLVSLFIIATALVALLGLHSRNIQVVAEDQNLGRASLLARDVMTRFLIEQPFPDVGMDEGSFDDHPDLFWQIEVLPLETAGLEENLREVRVRVLWDEQDPDAVLLVTHARNPQPTPPPQ